MPHSQERIVIVGAGMAGVHTAVALRERGWTGLLTVLGEEPHQPYDRPPLSKEVLSGENEHSTLDIDFDALEIELLLGRRAVRLDSERGVLHTDAEPVHYDRLVLATGTVPVPLPGTDELSKVYQLRTLDDAHALRAAFAPGRRIVVVGAGWIGAETATVARSLGCEVSVLEAAGEPLSGVLPAPVVRRFASWYPQAGVELRTGTRVERVEPTADDRLRVEHADGGRQVADAVVTGIGVRPATDWLRGSGVELDEDGAVRADEHLRTSLPSIWTVGDCASYPSSRYGTRLLVNHWDNALRGSYAVAASVLGQPEPYDPVPYFWSAQFGRFVQLAGVYTGADEVLWRGIPGVSEGSAEAWSVLWLRQGLLTAVLAVDRPRDVAQGRRLIAKEATLDREKAADPAVQLKHAVG